MRRIRRLRDNDVVKTPVAEKDSFTIRSAETGNILTDKNGRALSGIGREAMEMVRKHCEANHIEIMIFNADGDLKFQSSQEESDWLLTPINKHSRNHKRNHVSQ